MMTSSNENIFRVTGPLCGELTGPGDFPAQRPVTRSFDVSFDLRPNKRLSKQPWGWWFETPPWSLWRQCNEHQNSHVIFFFFTVSTPKPSSRPLVSMTSPQDFLADVTIPTATGYDSTYANDTWPWSPITDMNAWNSTAVWDALSITDNITSTEAPLAAPFVFSIDSSLHIYLAIRALLGIIIMTFNGLLLYCICYFPYLHTPTNTLVANLCIADFLGGLHQFFVIATVHHIGRSGWAGLCLIGEIINIISTGGNMWGIFGISLDSCLYICKPLHYHSWVTISRILQIMAILWIYLVTSGIGILLKFNRLVVGMPCRIVIIIEPNVYNRFYLPQQISLITGFLLCYCVIAVVAWKQKKRFAQQIAPAEANGPSAPASDWKIVKMMAMVPGIYILSMCPATVFGFVNNHLARETLVYADRAATILWWTQSWANPLIYAWKNENFRRAIKTVLRIQTDTRIESAWDSTCRLHG